MENNALMNVLHAPQYPQDIGNPTLWAEFDSKLKLSIPTDYKEFINLYGTGAVGDFIHIWNPFTRIPYMNLWKNLLSLKNVLNTSSYLPILHHKYKTYPDENGILPFGSTIDGDTFYWRIEEVRSERYEIHNLSLSDYLYQLFTNDDLPTMIYEGTFSRDKHFRPIHLEP